MIAISVRRYWNEANENNDASQSQSCATGKIYVTRSTTKMGGSTGRLSVYAAQSLPWLLPLFHIRMEGSYREYLSTFLVPLGLVQLDGQAKIEWETACDLSYLWMEYDNTFPNKVQTLQGCAAFITFILAALKEGLNQYSRLEVARPVLIQHLRCYIHRGVSGIAGQDLIC